MRLAGEATAGSDLLLRREFRIERQFAIRAGPARARPGEDSCLRLNWRRIVQRAGRNHDHIGASGLSGQAAAASGAEVIGKSLGLRDLEATNLLFATAPC